MVPTMLRGSPRTLPVAMMASDLPGRSAEGLTVEKARSRRFIFSVALVRTFRLFSDWLGSKKTSTSVGRFSSFPPAHSASAVTRGSSQIESPVETCPEKVTSTWF